MLNALTNVRLDQAVARNIDSKKCSVSIRLLSDRYSSSSFATQSATKRAFLRCLRRRASGTGLSGAPFLASDSARRTPSASKSLVYTGVPGCCRQDSRWYLTSNDAPRLIDNIRESSANGLASGHAAATASAGSA